MRVRLEDVAEAVGVSVTTVSRVLGGRESVAESTRAAVLGAIERLGYHRSTLLDGAPGRFIALGVPEAPEHWQLEVCRTLADRLQAEGLIVATPFLDGGHAGLRASVASGAALVATPTFSELDVDVPVVRLAESTFDEAPEHHPAGPSVGSVWVAARLDLTGGLSLAFEHLRALGHRRIGLVCNDSGALADQLRMRFLDEHPAGGLTSRLEEWIAPVPKSYSGGIAAALRLRDATCTAVIVQSALQLHGVFAAMRQRRRIVPRDLSVVGFGDSSTMRYTAPPATVLDIDGAGIARSLAAGVRSVLGLPGETMATVAPNFRPRLLARSSTAAAVRA